MTGSKSPFALFLIFKKRRQIEEIQIIKKKKTKNKQQQSWRHGTSIENSTSKKYIRSRCCFFVPSAVDSYLFHTFMKQNCNDFHHEDYRNLHWVTYQRGLSTESRSIRFTAFVVFNVITWSHFLGDRGRGIWHIVNVGTGSDLYNKD